MSNPLSPVGRAIVESEDDWVKLAAIEEKKALDEVRANLWSEHSHLFRWMTGSLLAINGGSAVAVLGSEQLGGLYKVLAGGFFSAGILSALLVGVFGQRASVKALPKIQELAGYWLSVSTDSERAKDLEERLIGALNRPTWDAYASRGAGWVSALLFTVGVLSTGFGISYHVAEDGQSPSKHRSAIADERPR